jgi:large repetitive protein
VDGSHAGVSAGLVITANSSAVRGLELTGWSSGIVIASAKGNAIGGSQPGAGNVISANRDGVEIFGFDATGNIVAGNYVGTDTTGRRALGNALVGIDIFAGAAHNTIGGLKAGAGAGNVISANRDGVDIFGGAAGNVVAGNRIGTDATRSRVLGNALDGVAIFGGADDNTIGGSQPGAENVISANRDGLDIFGGSTKNVVAGNYIGTNAAGRRALGNASQGVVVYNGAHDNTIGGPRPGDRNVISANQGDGVDISDKGTRVNRVQGNYVGTDVTGRRALGNIAEGVDVFNGASRNTIGGPRPSDRNVISANHDDGIDISDMGTRVNRVQGNYIGTDVTGRHPLGINSAASSSSAAQPTTRSAARTGASVT